MYLIIDVCVLTAKQEIEDAEPDGWVVSSESCSFNPVGASYYRDVLPGLWFIVIKLLYCQVCGL